MKVSVEAWAGSGHTSEPALTRPVPVADIQVLTLTWHRSGDSLALLSKDHFCLCFLEPQCMGTTGQLGKAT